MGEVIPLKHEAPREPHRVHVGMLVLLAAWAMMFVSLLVTLAFVRVQAEVWPPPGTPSLRMWPPLLALGCILLAVASFELGRRGIRAGHTRVLSGGLASALVFVVGFAVLLAVMVLEGRSVRLRGSYGALALTMVFFQLLQAGIGLPALVLLCARALRARYSAAAHVGVRAWALYWTFSAVSWSLILLFVFVL